MTCVPSQSWPPEYFFHLDREVEGALGKRSPFPHQAAAGLRLAHQTHSESEFCCSTRELVSCHLGSQTPPVESKISSSSRLLLSMQSLAFISSSSPALLRGEQRLRQPMSHRLD